MVVVQRNLKKLFKRKLDKSSVNKSFIQNRHVKCFGEPENIVPISHAINFRLKLLLNLKQSYYTF